MAEEAPSGIVAVRCDAEGVVREVLRDDYAAAELSRPLVDLAETQSRDKTLRFLEAVRNGGAEADWELNLATDRGIVPLIFAGAIVEGGLLAVGGRSRGDVLAFFERLLRINNEHVNTIHALVKDRVKAEREEERVYDELSRLNNELINAQRELAKKNAELVLLNEQKNVLLGMAAHDLRSPLSVIRTYARFLQEDAEEATAEERRTFARTIERTSGFMVGLIDDVLDLSAIEAGKLVLHREPVDLAALLAKVVEVAGRLAGAKGVTYLLDAEEGLPALEADGPKLEQVFVNLLDNAAKYSPPRSPVAVTLRREGDSLAAAVADRGQGIPPGDLSKLFQPFAKTRVRPTAGEKSTGLGLAIARRIVRGHGGDIEVTSTPGEGTTFVVRLPAGGVRR